MTIKLYYPITSTITINGKRLEFQNIPGPTGISTRKILFYDLPAAFLTGANPKFIHVRHVMALYNGNIPNDIKCHSSLVSVAPYDDSFTCFANQTLVKPKKFAYSSNVKTISFWFSDCYGNEVDIDAFVIGLMLEWQQN
jgi:hypothetical protein